MAASTLIPMDRLSAGVKHAAAGEVDPQRNTPPSARPDRPARTPEPLPLPHPDGERRAARDIRVDLLPGLAMLTVIVNHIRVPSLFRYVSEEPFMLVTGGETFVALSGFTLGMVYAPRLAAGAWAPAAVKIADRVLRLYRICVFVALSTY